jgi:hypothetical protein
MSLRALSGSGRWQWAAAVVLLVSLAGWHGWWLSHGWDSPGLSGHEFRQTQTGVTIRSIRDEGFRFDYSTPIMGKPWSIPFEFPTYQTLAAEVARRTGSDVITSGRRVSAVMFYLALPAFVLLLRRAGFSPLASTLGAMPLFFAPSHLLWTRAVMIESTALCASAWFLYFLFSYREKKTPALLAMTLVTGALASVTKATTWAVFCLPWAMIFFGDLWRARKGGRRAWVALADEAFLVGLPLLAVGFGWVWLTDRIKELNPIGGFLTSANLRNFNFGTWEQHWDPAVWKTLWNHWNNVALPWWALLAAGAGAVFAPARSRWLLLVAVATFFAGPFLFINLYAIHDYYFYAVVWAGCLAAGVVAAGWWDAERPAWLRVTVAAGLIAVVCAAQHASYRRDYYMIQTAPRGPGFGLADAIKLLTKNSDVIVMQSPDWSAIVPFWAERRMLMIPDSQMFLREQAVRESIELLRDESVPLVIFRGETRTHKDWILQRIRDFGLELFPLFSWEDSVVYARREDYRRMRGLLEQYQISGVVVHGPEELPKPSPPTPIAESEDMPNMEPRPFAGSFPYGIDYRYVNHRKALFVHPPTDVYFRVPAGASRVELAYQVEPQVFSEPGFDGVYVLLEQRREGAPPVRLHEELITREGPKGSRKFTLPLGANASGELVFRTFSGPMNNSAFDWVVLEELRIR